MSSHAIIVACELWTCVVWITLLVITGDRRDGSASTGIPVSVSVRRAAVPILAFEAQVRFYSHFAHFHYIFCAIVPQFFLYIGLIFGENCEQVRVEPLRKTLGVMHMQADVTLFGTCENEELGYCK